MTCDVKHQTHVTAAADSRHANLSSDMSHLTPQLSQSDDFTKLSLLPPTLTQQNLLMGVNMENACMHGRANGAPPSVKQHARLASNLPEVYPANKLDCSDGE